MPFELGSTQLELSSGGWPVWSGQFTPFGQEIVSGQVLSATLGNPQPGDGTTMHYKFTGKERDSESGLDYFGARYYASNVGRWISADWAQKPEAVPYSKLDDPQSLNLYEYVGNNPLSKADLDGHQWPDWATSLAAGAAKYFYNSTVLNPSVSPAMRESIGGADIAGNLNLAHPNGAIEKLGYYGTPVAMAAAAIVTDGAFGGSISVSATVDAPLAIESVETTSLLGQAEAARDALAAASDSRTATVTAGYNSETGQVATAGCGGGQCAEDHVNAALDGGATNFTKAIRPRTGKEVPVCERCEANYGRDKFPKDAKFKSDQNGGSQ